MKKLVILDSSSNEVHTYTILSEVQITEEYLATLGFNVSNCTWLSGDLKVINSSTILTGNETAPIPLTKWQEWYWKKGGKEKVDSYRYIKEYERTKNKK